MPKFFVSPDKIFGGRITIDTEDVQHITKVLRLSEGDVITVSDSTGTDYEAEILELSKSSVQCGILSEKKNDSESNISVTIYQALPKGTKMEYIIQKNTELGVVKIVPCALTRCVVKLDGKDAKKKCERWQKIADEAAKQSGRGVIPEIGDVIGFKEAVEEMKKSDLYFVPYESEENTGLKSILKDRTDAVNISFMIGPEGGFAPEEIAYIDEKGIKRVTLGPRILRTETAGEATLSMVMYELGDMG